VIEEVRRKRPVYPARFGTLFTSAAALADAVKQYERTLGAFFAMTQGRAEWGVKVFFDPEQAEGEWIRDRLEGQAAQLDALPSGRRYLVEQGLRREARKSLAPRLEALCCEAASRLTHQPDGLRERPLPPVEDAKHRPLAHWAVLWPLDQEGELKARLVDSAAALEAAGIQLEWTGPWPPYSFRPNLADDGL
jgi:hypothetical protein